MKGHMTRASWRGGSRTRDRSRDRRLALLKRAGLFGNNAQGARIVRATSLEDLKAAYGLVHDVFVRQGYILPDESGLRIRAFEAAPETATFVAKVEGEVVGVITLVSDSPDLGLPSDGPFGAELDALRGPGRKVCEVTNQVMTDSYRSSSLTTELMRCAFAHALAVGCTDFIGTVSPSHVGFYELLGFEGISEVRSYSERIEDPVAVVWLNVAGLDERFRDMDPDDEVEAFLKRYYLDENPYHRHVQAWQVLSERFFADPLPVRLLFADGSGFLQECDAGTRRSLKKRWGTKAYRSVCAGIEMAPSAG